MSNSEFSFIPRKLGRGGRPAADSSSFATISKRKTEVQTNHTISARAGKDKTKKEKYLDDSAYTALFELALSEHALWSNPELVEVTEASVDGFISLSHLIHSSPAFAGLSIVPPETVLVRCVRASSALEARLVVSAPSSSKWTGNKVINGSEADGGFEVRRKDLVEVRERIRKYTSFYWDNKTIYVENLPHCARTYYSVFEFVSQLLAARTGSDQNNLPVQSISFPRHQKDDTDTPAPTVGKGFAFVILSHARDIGYLLERWPWNLDERTASTVEKLRSPKAVLEAEEYGFRCLSKRKWDELKEKYMDLQRRLLERTLTTNVPMPSFHNATQTDVVSVNAVVRDDRQPIVDDERNKVIPSNESPSWFPKDCLVFVRNVHHETNKTTLRVLFASAFDKDASPIDYVDYNKGLDSCYLRLSRPHQARNLVSHFSEHKKVQTNALDNVGAPASGAASIGIEMVQGKKEELYWEKVPEKIRKAAMSRSQENEGNETAMQKEHGESGNGRGKRKRRRRD